MEPTHQDGQFVILERLIGDSEIILVVDRLLPCGNAGEFNPFCHEGEYLCTCTPSPFLLNAGVFIPSYREQVSQIRLAQES